MSVVTPTILSGGDPIPDRWQLLSVDVRREVNRIPSATLVFIDGSAVARKFDLSDTPLFEPGVEVEVKLRWEGETEDATVFLGLVMRHAVEASGQGSTLRVELKDAAVRLTQARKSAVFADQSDDEIISALLEAAGVEEGTLAATQPKHAQLVQYGCTGWDFILTRAEAQGLWVTADDGKLSARKPALDGAAKRTYAYGLDEIYDLEMEVDAAHQLTEVKSTGWDAKEGKLTDPAAAKEFSLAQGNLAGKAVAEAVGFGDALLSYPAPVMPEELQTWADAALMRGRLSLVRGRISGAGHTELSLLDKITIGGIGERFNGDTLVTGIAHRVDGGSWRTDVQFGLSAKSFALEEGVRGPPAAGLVPGIGGLQLGVVDAFLDDPEKQYRVKVILPGVDAAAGSVWARLAAPDAGNNRGWFFRPEEGDEVVIGFFNGDPRQPVILGSLFGGQSAPPEKYGAVTAENASKVIVTRAGTTLGFKDADKPSFFIETAGGAKLLLDDDAGSMVLSDQNGNEVKLDSSGITLKTGGDLKIEADGNVTIKGAKVDVQ